jgi:hypothetical protein
LKKKWIQKSSKFLSIYITNQDVSDSNSESKSDNSDDMKDSDKSSDEEEEKEEEEEDSLPTWDKKKSSGITNLVFKKRQVKYSLTGWSSMAVAKKPCNKFGIKYLEYVQYGTVKLI